MKRVVACGVLVSCLAAATFAQAPPPAPAPAVEKVPVLADTERLTALVALQQVEIAELRLKDARQQLATLVRALETKHPGWTVNLETLALVKAQPPKEAK